MAQVIVRKDNYFTVLGDEKKIPYTYRYEALGRALIIMLEDSDIDQVEVIEHVATIRREIG